MNMNQEEEKTLILQEASEEPDSSELPSITEKVYTVGDAINKIGFGPFQVLITVFCGLILIADAMELMILSILSPAVKCQWMLSNFEEAMITSIVFVGFLFGGLFWGVIFDTFGRKKGLFIINIVILIFGLLSALKVSPDDRRIPGYPWLLICRFGVGVGASGSSQVTTYYVEFLPLKARGICVVLNAIWWAIGTMFGAVLAIGVMRDGGLGWHWYLGLASLPLAACIFIFPLVPESARFYIVKGKNKEAQKVIKKVASYNCKTVPHGRLVSQEEKQKYNVQEDIVIYSQGTVTIPDSTLHDTATSDQNNSNQHHSDIEEELPLIESERAPNTGDTVVIPKPTKFKEILTNFSLLFTDGMWRTTVILLFLWFGGAWNYYGVVLLTTTLVQYDPHCGINDIDNNATDMCEGNQLDTNDYVKVLLTTMAELPGILFALVIIEILGRKLTLSIEFTGCMIGFLLLFICGSDTVIVLFLFIARAFSSGTFLTIYVYTPEVYPTKFRAFSIGIHSSAARIGAIATPYFAQVLLHANDYVTFSLYAFSSLVLAILALLLPIETKGRALRD